MGRMQVQLLCRADVVHVTRSVTKKKLDDAQARWGVRGGLVQIRRALIAEMTAQRFGPVEFHATLGLDLWAPRWLQEDIDWPAGVLEDL